MIVYLPCRLGEQFTPLKFKDWVNGERVYEDAPPKVLQGFWDGLFYPDVYAEGAIFSYDPTGKYGKGYEPKYKVSIEIAFRAGKITFQKNLATDGRKEQYDTD